MTDQEYVERIRKLLAEIGTSHSKWADEAWSCYSAMVNMHILGKSIADKSETRYKNTEPRGTH